MKKIVVLGLFLIGMGAQAMVPAVHASGDNRRDYKTGTVVGGNIRPAVRSLPERLYVQFRIRPEKVQAVQKSINQVHESVSELMKSYQSQALTRQQRAAMRDLIIADIVRALEAF